MTGPSVEPDGDDLPEVVVSNGFNKFFLGQAAVALARRGRLRLFITGAYPSPGVRRWMTRLGLASLGKPRRLLQRGLDLADDRIAPLPLSEAAGALGVYLLKTASTAWVGGALDRAGFRHYGAAASGLLRRRAAGAGLYQYRAGFGQVSTATATAMGMMTICDHSIAHPAVLEGLVANGGRFPDDPHARALSPWSRLILDDIRRADAVIVNSDFVRETFLHCGWDESRLHVVRTGVDDAFLAVLPARTNANTSDRRMLFAGHFETRKGADILVAALDRLADCGWALDIAGPVDAIVARRHDAFLARHDVRRLGLLDRTRLAATMAGHRLFVFPSLAEGSARVVMEAMAAGCFVITTPNAGSVVRHGIDGLIVPPGDPKALADAIRQAWSLGAGMEAAGGRAAEFIRSKFREADYGDRVIAAYRAILRHERSHPAPGVPGPALTGGGWT